MPNFTEIRESLNDLGPATLLALLIYGEARGESLEGQLAVAHVALNRMKIGGWFGKGLTGPGGVILKPFQFSCFNENDPNLPKLVKLLTLPDIPFSRCSVVAELVYKDLTTDPSRGATHYHTTNPPSGAKTWPPVWALKMEKTAVVGAHVFYREFPVKKEGN